MARPKYLVSKITKSTKRHKAKNNDLKNIELSNAYTQAWNEFNVRITARHHLITSYITISTLLLGVLISSDTKDALGIFAYFGVPSIALIFSLLLFIHDKSMNNLIGYMMRLETRNTDFPSYHATFIRKDESEDSILQKFKYLILEIFGLGKNLKGWGRQKLIYRLWQSIGIMGVMSMFAIVSFVVGIFIKNVGMTIKKCGVIYYYLSIAIYLGIIFLAIALKAVSIRGRSKACEADNEYQKARQEEDPNKSLFPD